MDNEKLLNKRWKYTEECLNKHLSEYKKLNAKTQDKIQDIFNDVKFTFNDLNKPITKAQKNKFLRVIEEWKDKKILIGYLEYKVKTLISQNIITNGELLDILIYGALCEERIELEKKENDLFVNIGNNLYNQAIEEIKITKPKYKRLSITWEYIYSLLIIPNTKGYQWKAYIEAMALSNSQKITRQAIIFLQQNKDLNINDDIFQNILRKQQNKYLSINDDKVSGSLDVQTREIANQSFIKAGEDNNMQQVRFISDMCDNVTMMCKNMNNYIFNIDKMNEYDRYMGETVKDLRWTRVYVDGLQLGMNLPPITHHFHYCHSTITYLIDL